MKTYETSATVQDRGELRLAGVPFAPGTEVEVTISPKPHNGDAPTIPGDGARTGGLRWEGNVLVHDGTGTGPSDPLADHREERLRQLGGGRPG
jgi:hypothetical protein